MKKFISILVPVLIGGYMVSLVNTVHVDAQRSDTIYSTVVKGLTKAPFQSAEVRTIGQSQHIIYVIPKNNPPNTCLVANPDVTINASYDGVNFFPLSAATAQGQSNLILARTGFIFASGLAPHVRVEVNAFDTVNCQLDIYYAGSLYPVYVDKMENTLAAQGLRTVRFTQSKAGTYIVIPQSATHPADSIAIYGLVCNTAVTQTFILGTGSVETENVYVAANNSFTMIPNGIPWLILDPGVDFRVTTGVDGIFSCFGQWRYE